MNLNGHDIAVCSWSLQPQGNADLVEKVKQLGLQHVQLALGPLVTLDDKRRFEEVGHLRKSGLTWTGGMMSFPGEDYSTIQSIRDTGGYVPDDLWPVRKKMSSVAATVAHELHIGSMMMHVGFVPPPDSVDYPAIVDRVRHVAESFQSHGIDLLMETGQEPADELLQFMTDLGSSNVHINFDPANMILYGAGDPIAAIGLLGKHIRHVHVKDATPSKQPGVDWGEEVPFGTGAVNPRAFLGALKAAGYKGPLAIEREAGNSRMDDVRTAIRALQEATK
jgi:L-ribulose-5-phosphate 3-epimerase